MMEATFRKLALAAAFSPRLEALLQEASRLRALFDAQLVVIHVGVASTEAREKLDGYIKEAGIPGDKLLLRWETGDPSNRIIAACREEKVDLLIAGALKKEGLVRYYLGSVARRILRRAECSVLTLLNPSLNPQPFKNIVVSAEDSPHVDDALQVACRIGVAEHTHWLHVVRELKLYGLTMTASAQSSESEYEDLRSSMVREEIENAQKKLEHIPHEGLKVNYKIISGKSGYELSQFAASKDADLLIVGAPSHRFSILDRFFTHDLEYLFANLPSNLLIVNPGKER